MVSGRGLLPTFPKNVSAMNQPTTIVSDIKSLSFAARAAASNILRFATLAMETLTLSVARTAAHHAVSNSRFVARPSSYFSAIVTALRLETCVNLCQRKRTNAQANKRHFLAEVLRRLQRSR